MESQEQMPNCDKVIDPYNSGSIPSTDLNSINCQFEYDCHDDAVWLHNAFRDCQYNADRLPGNMYWISGLLGTQFLGPQVWARLIIVTRWIRDWDMQWAQVADDVESGKMFTSVAAAMIYILLSEKLVMGLLLSMLWGNTLDEWVNMAQNEYPSIIGEAHVWYPLQRLYLVPCCISEIRTTPAVRHPAFTWALEQIIVITIPRVAATFQSVINKMTFGTDFTLVNSLDAEYANLTHQELNTSIDKLQNWWNIHLEVYHTSTSRTKPSSNGQLSYF